MWQRWQNKQPAISQPSHFTELDRDEYEDRYLETIMEVDSISSRRQSAHMGLPELPFRSVPPMRDIPQPVNVHKQTHPTSPTPTSRDRGLRIDVQVQNDPANNGVSPVTPRTSQERAQQDERPVSPIDTAAPSNARAPLPERPFQSQIPRKVFKPMNDEEQSRTKWDEYSGEPTNDGRGKESSVRPGSQPVEMQYPHLKERTKQILAGLRDRETAKKTPWGKAPPPVAADPLDDPPVREPWRGASGRAAIVDPVKNNPAARKGPVHFPQRNISRMNTHNSPVDEQRPLQTYGQPAPPLQTKPSQESIKPLVPLKTRNLTPPLSSTTPRESPIKQSPIQSPELAQAQTIRQVEVPKARVDSPQYDSEPTTPTTPVARTEPHIEHYNEPQRSFVPSEVDREQSRFSWTTYTASTADSPRSMTRDMRESSSPPPGADLTTSAITIKKRPVSSSPFVHSQPYMYSDYASSNSSVVRKPVPGGFQPRSSSMSGTSRAFSTSKALPPTPTITEAGDKIESLEAQLVSLERRKGNINRIVADLEAALKKNAVIYDMWKRREVEKNITNHKMELDDIGREIHEASLQLHRAQRKRDRDDNYESCTGLWIKRVTA